MAAEGERTPASEHPLERAATGFFDEFQVHLSLLTDPQLASFQAQIKAVSEQPCLSAMLEKAQQKLQAALQLKGPTAKGQKKRKISKAEKKRYCWRNANDVRTKAETLSEALQAATAPPELFETFRALMARCLHMIDREQDDRRMLGVAQEVSSVNQVVGFSDRGRRRHARHRHTDRRDASHRGRVARTIKANREKKRGKR